MDSPDYKTCFQHVSTVFSPLMSRSNEAVINCDLEAKLDKIHHADMEQETKGESPAASPETENGMHRNTISGTSSQEAQVKVLLSPSRQPLSELRSCVVSRSQTAEATSSLTRKRKYTSSTSSLSSSLSSSSDKFLALKSRLAAKTKAKIATSKLAMKLPSSSNKTAANKNTKKTISMNKSNKDDDDNSHHSNNENVAPSVNNGNMASSTTIRSKLQSPTNQTIKRSTRAISKSKSKLLSPGFSSSLSSSIPRPKTTTTSSVFAPRKRLKLKKVQGIRG